MDSHNVIIKPLVTEKSTRLQELGNTYAFQVALNANKHQIKRAIEEIYDVRVADVRTMTRKGKPRRTRFKMTKAPNWKRAVVTLEEDSRIELF